MMDRRRFAKAIAAAVVGVRVADKLIPDASPVPWPPPPITQEMLDDAVILDTTWTVRVPQESLARWCARCEHDLLYGTGRDEPRGILNGFLRGRHA